MQTQELVASAQHDNLDVAFGFANTMAAGIGKLAELNAQFTRATLKEALEFATKAAEQPQDWAVLYGTLGAPVTRKVQEYSRECLGIMSSTHTELLRVAREAGEARMHRIQVYLEETTKHAPAGSEAAVAAFRSAINAANTLYQTLGNAGQHAVKVAQTNFEAAISTASTNARRAMA
ncbi:phasin family protein [Paraburkholderia lycopersici]|uniref:Phasin family protein n=1 Tax=Paraburkholderia lycopersici TaxID=416944 RepID=A0A1G7CD00_9BURK|nr:phasin family protein [Paraburkholderia lycopersici]SDE37244.1 phasin family protein [Paraburkholderia lycopersici]